MKFWLTVSLLFSVCIALPLQLARMQRHGLYGTIVYRVQSEDGVPIQDATVQSYFMRANGSYDVVRALTDTNGTAELRGKVDLNVVSSVKKEGFYESRDDYMFFTADDSKVTSDGWSMHPTNTIVLRKVKHQQKMYRKRAVIENVKRGQPFKFDFFTGTVCDDNSPNTNACIYIAWNDDLLSVKPYRMKRTLVISFEPEHGGIQLCRYRGNSTFMHLYEAPVDGYNESIRFSNIPDAGEIAFPRSDGENIVYCVDESYNGDFIDCNRHYGMIFAPDFSVFAGSKDSATVCFFYYFNDTNDKNIEYAAP